MAETVGREAQQDAWLSVIIGVLLPLLGLSLVVLIGSRFADYTFAEYVELILGKWLGKLLALFFVCYCVAYGALVARIFVSMLKIYLFPRTPIWALVGLILLVTIYLVAHDVRVLARVSELMFYEGLVVVLVFLVIIPKIDVTFYQPVGYAGLENILKGTYYTIFAFLGVELLLVFYPMVQNKRQVFKDGLVAIVIVILFYLLVTLAALGVFGPVLIGELRFSLMVLQKINLVPVFERVEFFFIIIYVIIAFRPIAVALFAARYTSEKIFSINKPIHISLAIFLLAFVLAQLPRGLEHALLINNYVSLVGVAFLTVIPLMLWVIASLRKIGGESKNA